MGENYLFFERLPTMFIKGATELGLDTMKLDIPKPVSELLDASISGYPLVSEAKRPRGRPRKNPPLLRPAMKAAKVPAGYAGMETGEKQAVREMIGAERAVEAVHREAERYQQLGVEAPLPYGLTLEVVQRMAHQLMSVAQIAACHSLPEKVLIDCFARYPKLRHAFEIGAAMTVDRATATMVGAMEAGDLVATKFILDRKAGWAPPPRDSVVVINGGLAGMPQIDGSHVIDMAAQQRALRDAPDAEMAD